jgi:hypothetical protein
MKKVFLLLVSLSIFSCDDRQVETDILFEFDVDVTAAFSQTVINEDVPININILTDVSQDIKEKKRFNISWSVFPEGAASITKENRILSNGTIYEKESNIFFKGLKDGMVKVSLTLTDSYGIAKTDTLAVEVFKDIIFTRFTFDVDVVDSEIYNTSSGIFKIDILPESGVVPDDIKFNISKVNLSGNGTIENIDLFDDLMGLNFGEYSIRYSPSGADINQPHRLRIIVESNEKISVNHESSIYIRENKPPIINASASHQARRMPNNVYLNTNMEFDSYSMFNFSGSSDPEGHTIVKFWIEGKNQETTNNMLEVFDGTFYYYSNQKQIRASSRVFRPNDKVVIKAEDQYGAIGSLDLFMPQYPDNEPYNWAPIVE